MRPVAEWLPPFKWVDLDNPIALAIDAAMVGVGYYNWGVKGAVGCAALTVLIRHMPLVE